MYGTNEVEPLLRDSDGFELDVKEVFSTIQGEGPLAGLPATFVRLGGCHLKCWFCDTDFSSDRHKMKLAELVEEIEQMENSLVVLTGGEPMRQNVVPLCIELSRLGMRVQIETAGSFWTNNDVDGMRLAALCELEKVHIVVSPKVGYVHPRIEEHARSWKYIITQQDPLMADGLPLHGTQDHEGLGKPPARPPVTLPKESIFVQPCDQGHHRQEIWDKCVHICRMYGYRLSLQQHKLLGLP